MPSSWLIGDQPRRAASANVGDWGCMPVISTSGPPCVSGFRCGPCHCSVYAGISQVQYLPSIRNGASRFQTASMMSSPSTIISTLFVPVPKTAASVGYEPGANPAM